MGDPDDDFFALQPKVPTLVRQETINGVVRAFRGKSVPMKECLEQYGDLYLHRTDAVQWAMIAATRVYAPTSEMHKLVKDGNWVAARERNCDHVSEYGSDVAVALQALLEELA